MKLCYNTATNDFKLLNEIEICEIFILLFLYSKLKHKQNIFILCYII